MKPSFVISLCLVLPTIISACGQSGSSSGGGGSGGTPTKPSQQNTPENPAPGTVSDSAGFFVALRGDYAELFSIHKGETAFSEKCEAKAGEKIFCNVEGEEQRFAAHDVSLHYHVPKNMCEYIGVMPYYFVNRRSKLQTSTLHTYLDKNGDFGSAIDNTTDLVTNTDFGCHLSEELKPICCLGKYNIVSHTWSKEENGFLLATTGVNHTAEQCLGGPAVDSQPKTALGIPTGTYYYIPGEGRSATYDLKGTDSIVSARHSIVWNVNHFNPSDHTAPPAVDGIPNAMNYDIDAGPGTIRIGHPYYTFTCYDAAWEIKAQINVLLRDWDTKAGYEARATSPTGYRDTGMEDSPFGNKPKNDNWNWKDIEDQFTGDKLPDFEKSSAQ
jgi:hypothetical protein